MFKSMSVSEIFPTPLWIVDLEPGAAGPLNEKLRDKIEELTHPRSDRGPGGTWQTDQLLHTLPEFADFSTIVKNAARGALEFLEVEYDQIEMTACWANINPTGAQHQMHHHPNNFLSCVYYVQSAGEGGEIEFADPRPGAEMLMPPVKKNTRFNRNIVMAEAREGRLVMFPSYLKHSVRVNRSATERISIACNLMFPDLGTKMAAPLWEGTVKTGSD